MYALILIFAMFVGETEGTETRTCFYLANNKTYTHIIPVAEACPSVIEITN